MSAVAGKHSPLPLAPRLAPEIRADLMSLRDAAFNEGVVEGRKQVEAEYMNSGLITWAIGVACGVGAVFGFRAFAGMVSSWLA